MNEKEAEDAAHTAEFDQYAAGYSGGMEHPVKKLLGRSLNTFIEIKARLFVDYLRRETFSGSADISLLDYGCGDGAFLRALRSLGFKGKLSGCDVSSEMLQNARTRWEDGQQPDFYKLQGNTLAVPAATFDIVLVCCVLHHVRETERKAVFNEMARLLKPGGFLFVFEHNPINPATRMVIRQTPIDKNAVLLRFQEVKGLMADFQFQNISCNHFLFCPPSWSLIFRRLESCFRRIPLGGQYMIVGRKAPPSK